ncbi:MAG TPA: HesA/MoeB/ThiF family protein [Polyangiaceae bacterium]|nr:HesA/MoeB/ThiF family protein [Polyangiaceae bacterium]
MNRVERGKARVLLVGVGGLGCPAALALAEAGLGAIGLCDDDVVDRSNLHRQILFGVADVGARKVEAAARALEPRLARASRGSGSIPELHLHAERLAPADAVALVRGYDLILEGSDNFATKFLAADACSLAGVPVVHASAVRWVGTVLAVGPGGHPCYRCLFEDRLGEDAPNCATAGILGPVAGVVAACQVDLGLRLLAGESVEGQLVTFDGRTDVLRRRAIARRPDCPLCGRAQGPRIDRIDPDRYLSPMFRPAVAG